jgi:5'-methylthioadenosine phosphorylase
MELAIIGGTGVYDPGLLEAPEPVQVETPYGTASLYAGRLAGREAAFLLRHGAGHAVPPHRVNYRANLWALGQLGVRRVLASAACGSLRRELAPGTWVLVDQFLDFTRGRPGTFFDGGPDGVRHADMTAPYCPELRRLLAAAAAARGLPHANAGTYVCTEGPRFETAAEIRAYALLGGDVVGMTGVPEVVLARELGICYAAAAVVTNYAAGLAGRPLTHEEVVAVMARSAQTFRDLAEAVARALPLERSCGCPEAPGRV